jgi:hypothetical protein
MVPFGHLPLQIRKARPPRTGHQVAALPTYQMALMVSGVAMDPPDHQRCHARHDSRRARAAHQVGNPIGGGRAIAEQSPLVRSDG